jgi:hypothetical protein
MRIARSTGVASGLLIALLGIWGALIPFVGPYFDYSFGVNSTWHYTTDRLWLSIVPGAVALIGGLLLLEARTRTTALIGGWLAILAGAWFAIGPSVSLTWETGNGPIGAPLFGPTRQMLELIGYFYLLGALIIALGAFVLGRLLPARTVVEEPVAASRRGPAQAEPYAAGPGAPAGRPVAAGEPEAPHPAGSQAPADRSPAAPASPQAPEERSPEEHSPAPGQPARSRGRIPFGSREQTRS